MPDAHIVSINVSLGGIPKAPRSSIRLDLTGLEGDGHHHEKHNTPLQAVCLQDIEQLQALNVQGYQLDPGTTGENLTVSGLNVNSLPLGTQLQFQYGVVLELTKVRNPCYVLDAISPQLKENIRGRCGMYAKVVSEGSFTKGEIIKVISIPKHSNILYK